MKLDHFPGLRRLALLAAIAMGLSSCALPRQEPADSVYYGGKILTVDRSFSVAEAVAIRHGRFVAVGRNDDIRALIGPGTQVEDLKGRTVIPGLDDTHSHMELTGDADVRVPLYRAHSVREAQELIRKFIADKKVPPGAWVQGSAWHPPSQLAEKRYLTRQEIDEAAPDNPVYLMTVGHFGMANTRALQLAGIQRQTAAPAGGKIHVDQRGEPNGLLEEHAMDLVEKVIPPPTFEAQVAYNIKAQRNYNRAGITSVVSAAVSEADVAVYREVARRGLASVRATLLWRPPSDTYEAFEQALQRTAIKDDAGSDWVRVGGIKIVADGGMTLRTAYVREPYDGDAKNHGTLAITPAVYRKQVALANRLGWRVHTHAVGDAAIDEVLAAYEAADRERSIGRGRFSIIHASLITPDQLARAERLGLRVDAQNIFMWDKAATARRFIGNDRAQRAIPTRSLIEHLGYELTAAGTDNPVNTVNPFVGMYVMTTRKDPGGTTYGRDQAITRAQALRLYTQAGAYYSFEQDKKGSIEPGKLADMVILSDDFLGVSDERLKDIVPVKTIVEGKVVYEAPAR